MILQLIFSFISVLYLSVYALSIKETEINNLSESLSWNHAMEACELRGGNLPVVQTFMTGSGFTALRLLNREMENSTDCFWLSAKYERVDTLTAESYPDQCCEVLFKNRDGTVRRNCLPCNIPYGYLCAYDNATAYSILNDSESPWLTAAQFCRTHARGLPSCSNAGLLKHMPVLQYIWVNGVRRLNINPKTGDETFALGFCDGRICPFCSRNLSTYCVFGHGNSESSTFHMDTMNISSTGSTKVLSTSRQETYWRISTDVPALKETLSDNTALIGGITGAGAVLLIIIVIIVVLLYRRSKQTGDMRSNRKVLVHVNVTYDDVNSDVSDPNKCSENRSERNYSVPNKGEGYSEITGGKDNVNKTNEKEMRTAIYSEVLQGSKTVEALDNKKHNLTNVYEQINAGKSKQVEYNSHVYDKINFNPDFPDAHLENVYNKANFSNELQATGVISVYDNGDFPNEPKCERSGNVYARANVHRVPRDECTGNEYDYVRE